MSKIVSGTTYNDNTADDIISVLEDARQSNQRIRVWYGNIATGGDWGEEWNVIGYVGRSTGTSKIPLMIHNQRSRGGPGLMDCLIVKIADARTKRVLYQHPKYRAPNYTIKPADRTLRASGYTDMVFADGANVANFKTSRAAVNYVAFMEGRRMAK